MSGDKHINRLFEALSPDEGQKERMFSHIAEQIGGTQTKRRRFAPIRRTRTAVLVAALAVGLTTTAFAAARLGLDEAFIAFLHPSSEEQTLFLSHGAQRIDQTVKNERGTLEVRQVIGDDNLTYVLMDFTAPSGTVLDAARYRFEFPQMDIYQPFQSTGFVGLDDGNPHDNKITLMMSLLTESTLAGQNVTLRLKDLQAADPFPGEFKTIIPGTWEIPFELKFKNYSRGYPVNRNITMYGQPAVITAISVSPISITLTVRSRALKAINAAAGTLKEVGPNEYLDSYPVTIKYRDGTSETTSLFTGLAMSDYIAGQLTTIKTFEHVINDKAIASIVFFGDEIPVGEAGDKDK